jgi:hypothetical protein
MVVACEAIETIHDHIDAKQHETIRDETITGHQHG